MAIGCYEDARLLQYYAEREFKAVLEQHGRLAPALARVSTTKGLTFATIRFDVTFYDGLEIGWAIEEYLFSEQGRIDVLHPSVELDLRSLYSRLYEDHLIELDLRVAERNFLRVVEHTTDPDALAIARAHFDNHAAMIRQAHRGVHPSPFFGMDLARPEDRRGYTVSRIGASRQTEVAFSAVDYSQTFTVPELPEIERLTATQVRDLTRHARRHQIEALQQMMQMPPPSLGALNINAIFEEFFRVVGMSDAGDDKAQQKGLALLKDWLTPEQCAQYDKDKCFEVVGGTTGKRYRINHGRQQNIEELDERGRRVAGLCFLPEGQLVAGDVMLAQKIALETNERGALAVANRF